MTDDRKVATPRRRANAKSGGQIARFERWRKKLPANTAYLVSTVLETVVPLFIEQGFVRYPDYAANNNYAIGNNCIPLQRRSGDRWPTVEILFHKRKHPSLGVHFSELPENCLRWLPAGEQVIPRSEACVVEGDAHFVLCKELPGRFGGEFGGFGYHWFALRPKHRLDKECASLRACCTWLLERFNEGLPAAWYESQGGFVDPHAFLSGGTMRMKKSVTGSG